MKAVPETIESRPFFEATLDAAAPKILEQVLEQVKAAVAAKVMNVLCGCCRNITGRPPTPAVALWTSSVNGHTVALCQSCLDFWFDGADDDAEESGTTEMEPCRVQWLDGSRTLVAALTVVRDN